MLGRNRRRERRRDRHSNHFQRLHEHSTRGAERADPEECACSGGGWILSSCDVWETCSRHYSGQEHPEHRTSEAEAERQREIYVELCRERRTENPRKAHQEALQEKRRREEKYDPSENGPRPFSDNDEEGSGDGEEDPELPF